MRTAPIISPSPPAISLNDISIADLFDRYESIGFLYPEKKEMLGPFMDQIISNWETLVQSKEELLWIMSSERLARDFASISVWQNTSRGLVAQHLVSNGNVKLSLQVMLEAQKRVQSDQTHRPMISSQNWFRPVNRYAYKIFASIDRRLGPDLSVVNSFQYLHMDLDSVAEFNSQDYVSESINSSNAQLVSFLTIEQGPVFVTAEELDTEDITLQSLGKAFEKYDQTRSRSILKISQKDSGKIVACVIANRAPLGLNFSFLENRAYYILDSDLTIDQRIEVLKLMNTKAKIYYQDFKLQTIPIMTDLPNSKLLQNEGATHIREYMQSIWLREGFSQWHDHVASFLQKISKN